MRYAYPCDPEPDEPEGSFTVTFRDLPGAVTGGSTLGEALENAQEVMELVLGAMLEDGEDIPEPSQRRIHEEMVALTPAFAAKVAVITRMRAQGVSRDELGRRTGLAEEDLGRLLDPWEAAPMEHLTWALSVLGSRVVLEDIPEEAGFHFHEPAGDVDMHQDEFIRRLRRFALHRNLWWQTTV